MGDTYHVFEKAGLGQAPFTFTGCSKSEYQAHPDAPVQPGSSCDYCGTAIKIVCHIRSNDGKYFKVGNECVNKTGDVGLKSHVAVEIARHRRQQRHEREAQIIEQGLALLPKLQETLSALPHPQAWAQQKGLTKLDYVQWMLKNSGTTGKVSMAKLLMRLSSSQPSQPS